MDKVPQRQQRDGVGNYGTSWQGEEQSGPVPEFFLDFLKKKLVYVSNLQRDSERSLREFRQVTINSNLVAKYAKPKRWI
jgi:hypothetical protein